MTVLDFIGDNEALYGLEGMASTLDLRGKTVGTSFGSTAHYHLSIVLELFDLTESVTVVDVGSDCEGMWERGEIQGLHRWPPCTDYVQANGGKKLLGGKQVRLTYWS